MRPGVVNALTVDVEDYFQVNAFADRIAPDSWGGYPLRVGDNTRLILDLFDRFAVTGTFFVLGWVAERLPALVREIHRRGHEIACHGYGHQRLDLLGPERARDDIRRAKDLLEDLTGQPVAGYRAPTYSITRRTPWALDLLVELGFRYDSSIFPVRHDVYGMPDAPRFPHAIRRPAGEIMEFPPSTVDVGLGALRLRVPVAGGGYLRLFPTSFIQRAFEAINRNEGQPVVLYFHPWELDPRQPRIRAGWKSRFRHYVNLGRTEAKIGQLIGRLAFARMDSVLSGLSRTAGDPGGPSAG